jgi:hypothetical protein
MSPFGVARVRPGIVAVLVTALSAGVVACSAPAPAAPPAGSAAPAPAPSAPPPRAHRNAQYGYGLDPPPGWVSQPNLGKEFKEAAGVDAADVFVAPQRSPGGQAGANLTVVVAAAEGYDLKGAAEATKRGYGGPDYRLVADEAVTLADRRLGHLLGSSRRGSKGVVLNLQLLVVDRDRLYYVTTTSSGDTFAQDEPMLRSSLLSFTLGT